MTVGAADLTGQDFRQKHPDQFLTGKADFNLDGVKDIALLLVNQHSHQLGFFICPATAKGCAWHRLEVMDIAFLEVIGSARVKPGEYETGWGKGYWECDKDERETLKTKPDGAEFFRDDSASAVYVYDPATHKFIPAASSD